MEIWVILGLILAVAEIFGKKNQKKQPPKTTQMPEEYQQYDAEEYGRNAVEQPSAEPAQRPMQEKPVGLPKWLEEAMQKASVETMGKGEWQEMLRPEPVREQPRTNPVTVQEPVFVKPKETPKPKQDKRVLPDAKPVTATSHKMVLHQIGEAEQAHHVFEGKTMQDIKEVIVMSELLGPPLALRRGRRLI